MAQHSELEGTLNVPTLTLGELRLGETDARNEVRTDMLKGTDFFYRSFLLPRNIEMEALHTGQKFIIYGLKGTGKTALMHYLEIEERKRANATNFIFFKSEITEEDRQTFSKAAGYSLCV